ncbi:dynamin family protein [Clostridium neonatale]|uniref:dynamin family protein n=1 Tax=Clostridium neonatale TaxID=137838 RepID=UPI003D330E50
MKEIKICHNCGMENNNSRFFCGKCGTFLDKNKFRDKSVYGLPEIKVMRILDNLKYTPHSQIIWDDTIDLYTRKVEKFRALFNLPEMEANKNTDISEKMIDFLDTCYKPEFQIAFVGTIKTGKSTLINSLLGHNYASMAVTPETAALTKFRSSVTDYVNITFYSPEEWKELWASRTSGADAFMKEYNELNAGNEKSKWIGHDSIYKELANSDIEKELAIWSSSKRAEHYFVKEIEVGISSLPDNFPKQVVFVDTPGLSDPVAYRSEITKQYIRKANAVFVCVDAQKVQKDEIETISSVFSFSSHNKNKVHIIATHWDKLNKPEIDWIEQKKWLEKRLIGKGFFDTKEMANSNIMHSAAHIYNLCRDYDNLGDDDKITLMQFALGMKINPMDIQSNLSKMMELTNIENINRIVTDKLAHNYQNLLHQDIEKKYSDIIYTLKRVGNENKKQMKEIIEVSNSNMEEMKQKVEEQKRNYEEVSKCKEQLNALLKTVEKNTQRRLSAILLKLENEVGSIE